MYDACYYYAMTRLPGGTIHSISPNVETMLSLDERARATWLVITPLARNEWICLVESAKQPETKLRRLERARSQLSMGQRRPCCWEGCPHREKNGK